MKQPSAPGQEGLASVAGRAAVDELTALVYDQLRSLASRYLRYEAPNHLLQTTALVHEAYLRLERLREIRWRGRSHFLAVAATQMRRVLVDYARAEMAAKRGHRALRVTLDEAAAEPFTPAGFLDLQQALEDLGRRHPRQEKVAELKLFSGMAFPEISASVGKSERTVRGDWAVARAWLSRRLRRHSGEGA